MVGYRKTLVKSCSRKNSMKYLAKGTNDLASNINIVKTGQFG